ncbi:MAG: TrmB family transcriptional regulator [Candidatus Bathyarchaeia archaeon]
MIEKRTLLPLHETETRVLVELGLTFSEARVYLALTQIGPSQIGDISKVTGIHREHLYHTVHSLQDKCLVEREVESAARYKAISVDEAVSMLVKRKQTQISELETKAQSIVANFRKEKNNLQHAAIKELQDKDSQFVIVPGKEVIIRRIREAIQKAQEHIEIVTSQKRFSEGTLEFTEEYKNALERGVRVRAASEKHVAEKKALEIIQMYKRHPNYAIRWFAGPPPAIISIFDNKEAVVTLSAAANLRAAGGLWSNNACFLVLAQSYFESKWSISTTEEPS